MKIQTRSISNTKSDSNLSQLEHSSEELVVFEIINNGDGDESLIRKARTLLEKNGGTDEMIKSFEWTVRNKAFAKEK